MADEQQEQPASPVHTHDAAEGGAEQSSAPQLDNGSSDGSASASAAAAGSSAALDETDAEIEAIRARVAEMEEESRLMSEAAGGGAAAAVASAPGSGSGGMGGGGGGGLGSPMAGSMGMPGRGGVSAEVQAEQDARSIHVSQVDYSVTEDELRRLFEACGTVVRATIPKDRFTLQPKGFAYVEFEKKEAIDNAMILNETEFKGRTLKVSQRWRQRVWIWESSF
jgi:polyadenylate-binding protein 2